MNDPTIMIQKLLDHDDLIVSFFSILFFLTIMTMNNDYVLCTTYYDYVV
jgi:hypothetical protein